MTTPMTETRYEGAARASYGWGAEDPQSTGYIAPKILEILSQRKSRRVLDLGCGNGSLTRQLARAGYVVVGSDRDEQGVALARAACPEAQFRVCDTEQPAPDDMRASFDAVVSTEVIEHLYSPARLLLFAAQVLKADGILVLSTPYHGYLKNLVLSLLDKWDTHHTPLWEGGHIKFWSRRTLGQLLEAQGFREQEFYGVGRLPALWKSMIVVAAPAAAASLR